MNGTVAPPVRPFFFVHVMKTAGTTFAFHLRREFADHAIYPCAELDRNSDHDFMSYVAIERLRRIAPERRTAIRIYTGHFPFVASSLVDDTPVILTLLRDPVERTVSALYHFRRLAARFDGLSLDAIYDDSRVFHHFVHNHQARLFSIAIEDRPAALASTSVAPIAVGATMEHNVERSLEAATIAMNDARLGLAKANLERVDVIGLSSDYEAFVEELRRRHGWWREGLNVVSRANVNTEPVDISKALRQRIVADNQPELEFYEHALEVVNERRRT